MLVFVTTNALGFRVMSDIMANAGHINDRGFPDFTHHDRPPPTTQLFYSEIDELKEDLCKRYAARKMKMIDIFLAHQQYTASNYKDVLNELEDEHRITVDPPASRRRRGPNGKRSFKDDAIVTFPSRKK